MSLGHSSFSDTRRRRRRTFFWRLIRVLLALLVVVVVGGYAYQVGVSASQARTEKLEADLVRFQHSNLDLRDQLSLTTQRAAQAGQAFEELRRRYALDVPQGDLSSLLERVEAQLQAGVDPARLAFLIDAASSPASCDGQAVTKRFMPRTPISAGQVSFVRFDDRIMVTGTGQSTRNPDGLAEAWYDPAHPIRLEFRTLDGAVTNVDGVLPLNHGMVIDGREYRFSIVAGERWFVEVSAQSCALPQDASPQGSSPHEAREPSVG